MTTADVTLTLRFPVNIERLPEESYAEFHKRVVEKAKEQTRDLPIVGEIEVLATISKES